MYVLKCFAALVACHVDAVAYFGWGVTVLGDVQSCGRQFFCNKDH